MATQLKARTKIFRAPKTLILYLRMPELGAPAVRISALFMTYRTIFRPRTDQAGVL